MTRQAFTTILPLSAGIYTMWTTPIHSSGQSYRRHCYIELPELRHDDQPGQTELMEGMRAIDCIVSKLMGPPQSIY